MSSSPPRGGADRTLPGFTPRRIWSARRTVLMLCGARSGPRSKQLRKRDQPADDQRSTACEDQDNSPFLVFAFWGCRRLDIQRWVHVARPVIVWAARHGCTRHVPPMFREVLAELLAGDY